MERNQKKAATITHQNTAQTEIQQQRQIENTLWRETTVRHLQNVENPRAELKIRSCRTLILWLTQNVNERWLCLRKTRNPLGEGVLCFGTQQIGVENEENERKPREQREHNEENET